MATFPTGKYPPVADAFNDALARARIDPNIGGKPASTLTGIPKQGIRNDPLRGFRFRVYIPGFQRMGFKKVSGLKSEIQMEEYQEGGNPIRLKLPGASMNYDNLTFERGVITNRLDFFTWQQEYFAQFEEGAPEMRRPVRIDVLGKTGEISHRIFAYDTLPVVFDLQELDAQSEDVWMEKIELANHGWTISAPTS
jgi:phage tail-like protein